MPSSESTDPVIAALDELVAVLQKNVERAHIAMERGDAIRRLRKDSDQYSQIVPEEDRPLIVELITQNLNELSEASSRFRKAEARALYSEGLTMGAIAELFGVSRQRVAEILRADAREMEASEEETPAGSGTDPL